MYSKSITLSVLTQKTTILLDKFSDCLQISHLLLSKYRGSELTWNYSPNKLSENQCFQGVIEVTLGTIQNYILLLKIYLKQIYFLWIWIHNKLLLKQHLQIFFFQFWTLKATLKELKYFKETRGWRSICKTRAVFRTQSRIYNGTPFCKNSERLSAIFSKSFIIDVRLGSIYASEKTGLSRWS